MPATKTIAKSAIVIAISSRPMFGCEWFMVNKSKAINSSFFFMHNSKIILSLPEYLLVENSNYFSVWFCNRVVGLSWKCQIVCWAYCGSLLLNPEIALDWYVDVSAIFSNIQSESTILLFTKMTIYLGTRASLFNLILKNCTQVTSVLLEASYSRKKKERYELLDDVF